MQFDEIIQIIMASPIWIVAIILLVLMIIWAILATGTNGETNENKERKPKWSTVVTGRYAQNKYVQETSEKIRDLLSLNATYSFNNVSILEYEIDVILKSAQQYARFDFKEMLKDEFRKDPEKYNSMINPILENKRMYSEYMEHVEEIRLKTYPYELDGMREESYRPIEEKLFDELLLKPVVDFAFYTEPLYITGAGREHYHDMEVLWLKDVEDILKEIDDDTVSKLSREKERSLMSDSLRYDVLKRDNFRCTICGRTAADGIKLHVDHIMPVAKGGKTEMNNLRTLCNQCNSGKSDKWDEDGLN